MKTNDNLDSAKTIIKVLSVLTILGGIFITIISIGLLSIGPMPFTNAQGPSSLEKAILFMITILGIISIISGIGLLKFKPWARIIFIILSIISIISCILVFLVEVIYAFIYNDTLSSLNGLNPLSALIIALIYLLIQLIMSLIIPGFIFYYITFNKKVKEAFQNKQK